MARCRHCRKFVTYGTPRVDPFHCTLEDTQLRLQAVLTLPCAVCRAALTAAEFAAHTAVPECFPQQPDPARGEIARYTLGNLPQYEVIERKEALDSAEKPLPTWMVRLHRGLQVTAMVVQTICRADDPTVISRTEMPVVLTSEKPAASFLPVAG